MPLVGQAAVWHTLAGRKVPGHVVGVPGPVEVLFAPGLEAPTTYRDSGMYTARLRFRLASDGTYRSEYAQGPGSWLELL